MGSHLRWHQPWGTTWLLFNGGVWVLGGRRGVMVFLHAPGKRLGGVPACLAQAPRALAGLQSSCLQELLPSIPYSL